MSNEINMPSGVGDPRFMSFLKKIRDKVMEMESSSTTLTGRVTALETASTTLTGRVTALEESLSTPDEEPV